MCKVNRIVKRESDGKLSLMTGDAVLIQPCRPSIFRLLLKSMRTRKKMQRAIRELSAGSVGGVIRSADWHGLGKVHPLPACQSNIKVDETGKELARIIELKKGGQ